MTRGLCWRGLPQDDAPLGVFGDMSAYQALYASDDEKLDVGASLINLAQGELNKILYRGA